MSREQYRREGIDPALWNLFYPSQARRPVYEARREAAVSDAAAAAPSPQSSAPMLVFDLPDRSDEPCLMDPVVHLPGPLAAEVIAHLDIKDVLISCLVSRAWLSAARWDPRRCRIIINNIVERYASLPFQTLFQLEKFLFRWDHLEDASRKRAVSGVDQASAPPAKKARTDLNVSSPFMPAASASGTSLPEDEDEDNMSTFGGTTYEDLQPVFEGENSLSALQRRLFRATYTRPADDVANNPLHATDTAVIRKSTSIQHATHPLSPEFLALTELVHGLSQQTDMILAGKAIEIVAKALHGAAVQSSRGNPTNSRGAVFDDLGDVSRKPGVVAGDVKPSAFRIMARIAPLCTEAAHFGLVMSLNTAEVPRIMVPVAYQQGHPTRASPSSREHLLHQASWCLSNATSCPEGRATLFRIEAAVEKLLAILQRWSDNRVVVEMDLEAFDFDTVSIHSTIRDCDLPHFITTRVTRTVCWTLANLFTDAKAAAHYDVSSALSTLLHHASFLPIKSEMAANGTPYHVAEDGPEAAVHVWRAIAEICGRSLPSGEALTDYQRRLPVDVLTDRMTDFKWTIPDSFSLEGYKALKHFGALRYASATLHELMRGSADVFFRLFEPEEDVKSPQLCLIRMISFWCGSIHYNFGPVPDSQIPLLWELLSALCVGVHRLLNSDHSEVAVRFLKGPFAKAFLTAIRDSVILSQSLLLFSDEGISVNVTWLLTRLFRYTPSLRFPDDGRPELLQWDYQEQASVIASRCRLKHLHGSRLLRLRDYLTSEDAEYPEDIEPIDLPYDVRKKSQVFLERIMLQVPHPAEPVLQELIRDYISSMVIEPAIGEYPFELSTAAVNAACDALAAQLPLDPSR